ncbi:MAG: TlpA disulfide reductase family protein [Chloroflexota bacterium]|nr:TlpA disulfide reductase family protein [Chloroflexota bacterium]
MTGISVRRGRISWENIRLRWLLILAAAAIACSNYDSNSNFVSSTASGDLAPDLTVVMFQGQDVVGGEKVTLSGLIGGRPIVLNFWAGLCPPCRAEMPDLQEFNEDFQDRALLLGVDLGQFTGLGNTDDAKKLLSDLAITYPAGSTSDSDVIRNYQVLGMPTTIFIDREGRIFNRWTGALNKNVLIEKTQEMLGQ